MRVRASARLYWNRGAPSAAWPPSSLPSSGLPTPRAPPRGSVSRGVWLPERASVVLRVERPARVQLLDEPAPGAKAAEERAAQRSPELPQIAISHIQEVPLARNVPQVTGPCGDIVGGWFQSVDDLCVCSAEAGDIHITEDELSPMTRASLCDLVD